MLQHKTKIQEGSEDLERHIFWMMSRQPCFILSRTPVKAGNQNDDNNCRMSFCFPAPLLSCDLNAYFRLFNSVSCSCCVAMNTGTGGSWCVGIRIESQ